MEEMLPVFLCIGFSFIVATANILSHLRPKEKEDDEFVVLVGTVGTKATHSAEKTERILV